MGGGGAGRGKESRFDSRMATIWERRASVKAADESSPKGLWSRVGGIGAHLKHHPQTSATRPHLHARSALAEMAYSDTASCNHRRR